MEHIASLLLFEQASCCLHSNSIGILRLMERCRHNVIVSPLFKKGRSSKAEGAWTRDNVTRLTSSFQMRWCLCRKPK